MSAVVVHGQPLGPFETNCYVVCTRPAPGQPVDPACFLVDPGYQPAPVLHYMKEHGLHPEAIVLTHAHADHILGLEVARQAFPHAPVLAHSAERAFFGDPELNLSAFAGMPFSAREPTDDLFDGQELTLNGTRWQVLHTPGHSPGGITLVCPAARTALVGDTLFAGSIGRSDLPTSNPGDLHRSLHQVLLALPDDTAVHPGHGPATTIGRERATNPFLRDSSWAAG